MTENLNGPWVVPPMQSVVLSWSYVHQRH